MAVLEIKTYPEKVLKEKTAPVVDINGSIHRLIDDMIETMYAAKGVGLAANQVGISKRLCVIDVSTADERIPLIVLINPKLVEKRGSVDEEEGCLSIPEYRTKVKRAEEVVVRALDRKGNMIEIEGKDLLARALQHEIDHLDGLLFIDRISPIKREFFKKRFKKTMAVK
ncbi:MAG: peptide deformylase [Nitrospirae bacterium]|nr:MAG: peptide deformylase [Nitrospirota bacterium]